MKPSPSLLQSYRVRHYKSFVDTGWIDIAPLSLVFGHNSSGKTALLSVLPMLRQTIEDPDPSVPFVFSSEGGVDLGVYEEVVHDHIIRLDTPLRFSFKVSLGLNPRYRFWLRRAQSLGLRHNDTFVVDIGVNYNKKRRKIAITNFSLCVHGRRSGQGEIFLLKFYRKTTAERQKWHVEFAPSLGIEVKDVELTWTHFLPRIFWSRRIDTEKSALTEVLRGIYYAMEEALRKVVHLGPSRAFPRRAYRITGESPRDVGILGENWLNILMKAEARQELLRNVNQWLKRLGYALKVEWGRQGYIHPVLRDEKAGIEVSLKDVGFGISQILPILVQGFASPPGTILILEQPEIHLHPRAQADLGDMLMGIAQRGVHLLVETHSEHLLLRIQRRLAEKALAEGRSGSLNSDQVAIYYVEKPREESMVYRLQMDKTGSFLSTPENFSSFFSDDYNESVARAKALALLKQREKNADSD